MKTLALCAFLLSLSCAHAAQIDMNTQTCQDWLDAGEDEQDAMVSWLRGYAAGRAGGAMFDLAAVRTDALFLKKFCQGHMSAGLVSAASQWKH